MTATTTLTSPRATISDQPAQPVHPLGSRARVLLTSVFGPYAQDDEYGSRALNPMELYHNQVTRTQGVFSLRMFHRSWGLMLIQANINAPCTLLDFPTLDRFIEEISTKQYDIVGISSIMPNVGKVRKMCELIREHLPDATIVVGGHVANLPGLDARIDADHIVRGEGVRWMREFLSEKDAQPINHPEIPSGIGTRCMGVRLSDKPGEVAAALIPSVGCPLGCNFCATSAMFGGKGHCVHFYETGDELFEVMCQLEKSMQVKSFFVMDENFLLHRKRALRLLDLMIEHNKPWALYVFSSANIIRSYTMEQLVALGISWVWMGLEGKNSRYSKLNGIDTRKLVRELQSHGIRVLGSSIIGLEEHTPENIDDVIDYAVSHDTEFHQFMLYTPTPGTPLYKELEAEGRLLDPSEYHEADIHGQLRFNYRHPHIKEGLEGELILRAFRRDFEINGPSIMRMVRTMLQGWRRYKNHPDERIRSRFEMESRCLSTTHAAGLWAMKRWFHSNPTVLAKISKTLSDVYREFGLKARLSAAFGGPYVRLKSWREDRRLKRGDTHEPPTFYEAKRIMSAAGMPSAERSRPCSA
ncbi:MAG: radical SAM protein [Planctomycetes bacterium]|nr:radical SAM protein [Planctomycetota bacterium]